MPHVFLSYSRQDTEFVETLERDLNTRGIATWRDTSSIVGGEEWYKAIVLGIHDAYAMIQVVTPAADLSKWVLREALYADQKGLPIIPVLPRPHPTPFHLIATQPILFGDYDTELTRLVAALETIHRSAKPMAGPVPSFGPADRDTELAYLDFVLSEMKAELRTARYVNLGATREEIVLRQPLPMHGADEFEMSFDRFEPLVKAECLRGEDLAQAGETVEDARVPLREMKRAILLGEPGSGKTTTLQQLAIDLARVAHSDSIAPMPVFVPLRSYSGEMPFSEFVQLQLGPLQSQYERLLTDGRLVLLCDALNEMQRRVNGRNVMDDVRDYLREHKLWIVSCRVRDYQEELKDLQDVGKVRLKPLDLPRIKQVIERRFGAEQDRAAALWASLKGSDNLLAAWQLFEDSNMQEAFWGREWPSEIQGAWISSEWKAWWRLLGDSRRMMQLCRNPFMLFMVCGTFERVGQLPPNRGALFATFVDNLLMREERSSHATGRVWIDAGIIRQALAKVAYAIQRSETGVEIVRTEAERLVVEEFGTTDPVLLLRLAASASLLEVGDRVRFTHQLLQEYFASEIMGRAMDEKRLATEFWPQENWWKPQGWEETAIILAGVRGDPESVAGWIAPAQPEVAYQTLMECGIEVSLDELKPETHEVLVQNARTKTAEINPAGRATAYRVLGFLQADRRSGIGLHEGVPSFSWSGIIKAGMFVMGGDPNAYNAWEGTQLKLDYPFWISRYPVTYAQYEAFVRSNGYHEHLYWTRMGWEWKGDDAHPNIGWNAPEWHISNHPVVGISWHEAHAYTQWLNTLSSDGKLALPKDTPENYIVRLPTEAEWEKAVRYPDDRQFPWGDEYVPGYANIDETARFGGEWVGPNFLGRTTAVGIYQNGVNPSLDVYDLSGNVWEWCLSQWSENYQFPENNNPGSDIDRVVRGGSWGGVVRGAHCASRRGISPNLGSTDWGFRIVYSVPLE